jgi:hypothetical protein
MLHSTKIYERMGDACLLSLPGYTKSRLVLVAGDETRSDKILQKANFYPPKTFDAMLLGSNSVGHVVIMT